LNALYSSGLTVCLYADAVQWDTGAVWRGWSEIRLWCSETTWIRSRCHHALHQVRPYKLLPVSF